METLTAFPKALCTRFLWSAGKVRRHGLVDVGMVGPKTGTIPCAYWAPIEWVGVSLE